MGTLYLQTERLIIRRFSVADKEGLFELVSDESTCSDDGGYTPYKSMDEEFCRIVSNFAEEKNRFSMVLKDGGKMIGTVHLMDADRGVPALEIGYAVNKRYRRQGYGFESVSAVIDFCFDKLGAEMMVASAFSFNKKSQNMLNKLGFIEEGVTHKAQRHSKYGTADLINYYKENNIR